MKPRPSSGLVWLTVLSCGINFGLAHVALAQADPWDPGVPGNLIESGQTKGKNPKPTRRVVTACKEGQKDCQPIADQLQAALDDWYAMMLAEAQTAINEFNSDYNHKKGGDAKPLAQKAKAMEGLGQPDDNGKGAKAKQEQNAEKDPTRKSKDALAKEIKRLSEALQTCLKKKCPTPTPTPTPTVTPTPTPTPSPTPSPSPGKTTTGGGGGGGPAPNITIPKIPACLSKAEKDDFISKLDERRTKENQRLILDRKKALETDAKSDLDQVAQDRANLEALDKAIADADKITVPCPSPTPSPTPKTKTGGGTGMGPQRTPPGEYASNIPGVPNDDVGFLVANGNIKVETVGTGETIGHIADVRIENLTDHPLTCVIPPMIMESSTGDDQDYGCPKQDKVTVGPHERKTVPRDGVCLNRHKPPVHKNVVGRSVFNEGNPDIPQDSHSHLRPRDANKLLRRCQANYDAADKLENDGVFKDFPYKNREERKRIVKQWLTWSDPEICALMDSQPATKEDFKKTIYKQAAEHGPVTPEIKKQIEKGSDTMWSGIQLAGEEAKDLEKPDPYANVEVTGDQVKGAAETPQPTSTEKPQTPATAGDVSEPPQEHEETTVNVDGSRTTTTTRTDGNGNTTTVVRTDYQDETFRQVTTVKFKSGATTTQTIERDGSSTDTHDSIDEDTGSHVTTTSTIDKSAGTQTDSSVTVEKNGAKTSKTTTKYSDGTTTRSRETVNPDGSKETSTKARDGSWTWSSTDKDGKTYSTAGDGKGHDTGKTAKGSYTVDKQADGSKLVHWTLPNGTGGSKTFRPDTDINPDTDETNPLPFKAQGKEPPPAPVTEP